MLEAEIILAGILQGIFEWLPISSEGVVSLFSHFFIRNINPLDFSLVLHFGTLFSVLIYFLKDWINVLFFKDHFLFWFLAISTSVSLVVGFLVYKSINNFLVGNLLLLITGVGLLFTSFFQRKKLKIEIEGKKLAVLVGILQGFSVIPGFSRSGSTIFGLSFGKFSPPEILKISYMMSAPVVFASSLYFYLKEPNLFSFSFEALIFSFLTGILTLHFLMRISQKINFSKFTLIFGLLCILGATFSAFFNF
jgi:undecaprenyl-diphosphatase